ncbi:MAG: low specificity L-threonine aldolase [Hamadaea sp.]|uniref:threonine aldolase family protein n=1 Tax=Hamadaea sp. TaxID=2024425 RepID=UPI0017B5D8B8|nr:GntG family PLP-dependent aldolase [Hamadaea sp.]NUR73794.1 low specificity L-threonine aldolase [Hamadaea sp.]NUT22406.1 low specificity L-threonine aldolase [Hamadaea sp.]
MADVIIDLRSDTVTRPSAGMREAMMAAEVGDDVFGDDPTVIELERRVAQLLGHEAALFAPSGTMANQICLQTLVPPTYELLCDVGAHIVTYELAAAAAFGGISTRTWTPGGSTLDLELIESLVMPEGFRAAVTRAIAVEQTYGRDGGTVIAYDSLAALRRIADRAGVALHCDGARIWHASVATGVPLDAYGALFDTMSVCLSKGLGAPVGSVLVSSAENIERARLIRKRMGGGMRQVGILAAAGLYALEHNLPRLDLDHAKARRLASALAQYGVCDPATVETNMVMLDLREAAFDGPSLARAASAEGILCAAVGPRTLRLIPHLDVDDDGIDRAIEVFSTLLK